MRAMALGFLAAFLVALVAIIAAGQTCEAAAASSQWYPASLEAGDEASCLFQHTLSVKGLESEDSLSVVQKEVKLQGEADAMAFDDKQGSVSVVDSKKHRRQLPVEVPEDIDEKEAILIDSAVATSMAADAANSPAGQLAPAPLAGQLGSPASSTAATLGAGGNMVFLTGDTMREAATLSQADAFRRLSDAFDVLSRPALADKNKTDDLAEVAAEANPDKNGDHILSSKEREEDIALQEIQMTQDIRQNSAYQKDLHLLGTKNVSVKVPVRDHKPVVLYAPGHLTRKLASADVLPATTTAEPRDPTKLAPADFVAPTSSDIWSDDSDWKNFTFKHPAGVISNVHGNEVRWADVGYLSLDALLFFTLFAYPVIFIGVILFLVVVTSMLLSARHDVPAEDPNAPRPPPVLAQTDLSPFSQKVYACWAFFCCCLPAIMVFGTPVLMACISYPYPQEVFLAVSVVCSAFVFMNSVHMTIFGRLMIRQMRLALTNPGGFLSARGTSAFFPREGEPSEVVHWVLLPNYKEDLDILSASIESVGKSPIARTNICVLLCMEEREAGSKEKAAKLKLRFAGRFRQVEASFHPPNLPNDPPGKASNSAWGFKWLVKHLDEKGVHEQARKNIVMTVADADSEFHTNYFSTLGHRYSEADENMKADTIWQSPIFHIKNYHRQPSPVLIGTIFTAMTECSVLLDPNTIRFPYSSYSAPYQLVERVGGWDPEWIAEDWHMGIKCYLLTLGRANVKPILLPTVNYTPEDTTWWGTILARWAQAKRHTLGFSDFSYFFMMLPLIFAYLSTHGDKKRNVGDFWKLLFEGTTWIVRLVNVHVIVGVMTLYAVLEFFLKVVMFAVMNDFRNVEKFFDHIMNYGKIYYIAALLLLFMVTLNFQSVYALLQDKLEPSSEFSKKYIFKNHYCHLAYTVGCALTFGPIYFFMLGLSVWIAAVKVISSRTFEYEVAAKPTQEQINGKGK
eukprot:gnl/TRDRNA2_/TRDRNA2_83978_c0_seq2.p1 gnl/TRDRNA2_/TRDRNA2_83978_c0~~gnl/TRDRNA2_/TRDRNA2_83978_c0_seq2.p1  ORF type:complete len:965 (+),score=195.28 gnl/TRDRNA2_/TRDRNA2_83978_c0_seq2:97-2991(+)